MIARVGDTIENPVTGERITWLTTASSSAGALLAFELAIAPGASVAAPHRHARQQERFTVERGSVWVDVAGERRAAVAGEAVIVPIGAPHLAA